jgi:tetratricopeptide (TPR) repeat protein
LDAAVAAYRTAIEAQPSYAEAHCNLGSVLRRQGRFAESLASYRRGHELGSTQPGWRYSSSEWVRQAERLAALEEVLPRFQAGEFKPRDNSERLDLAEVCRLKQLHRAAVRLYADAFADAPELADDLKATHRYKAACAAALAAAGQGTDAGKLDNAERSRVRGQGLEWLRADVKSWGKCLESGKAEDQRVVREILQQCQRNADLTSVRDPEALKKLPADEQAMWRKLWDDVAQMAQKAGE